MVAFRDLEKGLGQAFEIWPARAALGLPPLLVVQALDESLPVELISSNPERGIEVTCSADRVVDAIFLHAGRTAPFRKYAGQLPNGLSFESPLRAVLGALGHPTSSGNAKFVAGLGDYGAWVRYDRSSSVIHFQIEAREDRIKLITVMHPSVAPEV